MKELKGLALVHFREGLDMNLQESITLIKGFNPDELMLAAATGGSLSGELEQSRAVVLPPELKEYLDGVCPLLGLNLESVGHPVELLSRDEMSWDMDGYNVNR